MENTTIINALTTFPEEWDNLLKEEKEKPYYQQLAQTIAERYESEIVYPPVEDVFNAFKWTKLSNIKVVIIGQDPYFNEGQANGLAFSVHKGVRLPPSLQNIYKELYYEFGYPAPKKNGSLEPWAKQGVLLLNASLTVHAGNPNSHANLGWQTFTNQVISLIDEKCDRPIVYLLWGRFAQEKKELIKNPKACVIETAHPSPMSANRGFFCSDCFKRANKYLVSQKVDPIDWQIKEEE